MRPTDRKHVARAIVESAVAGVVVAIIGVVLFNPNAVSSEADAHSGVNAGGSEEEGDVYARLPSYPTPFTPAEMIATRAALSDADASLARVRASTDVMLARIQDLSASD